MAYLVRSTVPRAVLLLLGFVSADAIFLRGDHVKQASELTGGKQVFQIAHIIAPVPHPSIEEELVFKTMEHAKKFAEKTRPGLGVTLHAVQAEGDAAIELPDSFMVLPPLKGSTATKYKCNKRIPLVSDVIRSLQAAAPDADAYIVTNADINLMPRFYLNVYNAINHGADGLDVLKVLIPQECKQPNSSHKSARVPTALNMTHAFQWTNKLPQFHPGSDCLVWKSNLTGSILKNVGPDVFFGWAPFGHEMVWAINKSVVESGAGNFSTIAGEKWTFHIGGPGETSEHGVSPMVRDFITQSEREHPRCKFYPEGSENKTIQKDDTDCDYNLLNHQASRHLWPMFGKNDFAPQKQ